MQGFSEGRAKSVHWVERAEAEKVVFIFTGPHFAASTSEGVGIPSAGESASYRVTAVNFSVFGSSEGYTSGMGASVGQVLSQASSCSPQGTKSPALVGASMGGRAVLGFAASERSRR